MISIRLRNIYNDYKFELDKNMEELEELILKYEDKDMTDDDVKEYNNKIVELNNKLAQIKADTFKKMIVEVANEC